MVAITALIAWTAVSVFGGVAQAATASVKWNKDGSITFKNKNYSKIISQAPNTSNTQVHLLTANETNTECPATEIVFPVNADIKTAKTATYYVNKDVGTCLPATTIKLTITNTRPGASTTGSDPLTNGITQDGTQQPSAADLASCSTANGYAPDPAICGTPCKNADNCDLTAKYINPFINKFLAPLAILAVIIGVIWGAIEYIMSGGDSQKVAQAKNRIQKALVGLVAFIFLYALLNWLIPGGLLP